MLRRLPVSQLKSARSAPLRLPTACCRSSQKLRHSTKVSSRTTTGQRRGGGPRRCSPTFATAAVAAVAGGLVGATIMGWERDSGKQESVAPMSYEREELRRVALTHLTESANRIRAVADGNDARTADPRRDQEGGGSNSGDESKVEVAVTLPRRPEVEGGSERDGNDRGEDETPPELPENLYDLDRVMEKNPLMRNNNAFHETLNSDDAISCPYVLGRPDREGRGIEAVVRFGKSVSGHPKIVHGGVTALTFDNLFGVALFLDKTGPVVTAYIKVEYKAALPCLTTAIVDITIDRKEGRKFFVTGRLKSLDGTVTFSSAEALFIQPKRAHPPAAEGATKGSNKLIQGLVV